MIEAVRAREAVEAVQLKLQASTLNLTRDITKGALLPSFECANSDQPWPQILQCLLKSE